MVSEFLQDGFRKVTGPIEHWLTTYHTNYWGFRPDKKSAWEEIEIGEVFLFHASASKFLDVPRKEVRDAGKGVIGLGRVGAKSVKDDPAWWEEIHDDGNYPYLIHFSEIYWFGNTAEIRDVPVREKSVEEMVEDVHHLDENKISFKEMDEKANYRIPAQGSPGNVKYPEKLFPLLVGRIHGSVPESTDTSEESKSDSGRSSSTVRSRNRDRDLDASSQSSGTVTYDSSVEQTMEGWIDHEHALDTFEDALVDAGFDVGETKHSDILGIRENDVVLAEAKSIHEGNERSQIRTALGQIHEYSYFDVNQDPERGSKELTQCLVLTREPSTDYRGFLEALQAEGIYTFWPDEFNIEGVDESLEVLEDLRE